MIKIICFDEATEAIALRSVLERFNFKVELAYVGRPNDFLSELNNSEAIYIIPVSYTHLLIVDFHSLDRITHML